MHRFVELLLILILLLLSENSRITAAEKPVDLINPKAVKGGWTFDNGREFPGATGKLELETEGQLPTLNLFGDFTGGGAYVQTAVKIPDIAVDSFTFEIKVPSGVSKVTTRIIDGTDQCHQLDIRLNDKGGWQKYTFPVARFFQSVKAGSPMDIVTRYEKWGGVNDGSWHQPCKLFVILAGKDVFKDGYISIRNVQIIPQAPQTDISTVVRLDDFGTADTGAWEYNGGWEFKGAKGSLTPAPEIKGGINGVKLSADFTAGGRYVGMRRSTNNIAAKETSEISFYVRSSNTSEFSLRLVDSQQQTHQKHGMKLKPDGEWQHITIDPVKFAGGENWGGINDGKWHGAVQLIELMLNTRSADDKKPAIEIADIQSKITISGSDSDIKQNLDFSSLKDWTIKGDVSTKDASENQQVALSMKRTLEQLPAEVTAISPVFSVSQGAWKYELNSKSKLHSPDNSYHVELKLELLDQQQKVIDSLPVDIITGDHDWTEKTGSIMFPPNVTKARWRLTFEKTYGEFLLSSLILTRLQVQPAEPKIESIRIKSKAIGNLFKPEEPVQFDLEVYAVKSLAKGEQVINFAVKDYLGNDHIVGAIPLINPDSKNKIYKSNLILPLDKLNVGQFYELHLAVPQGINPPVQEFSGFAILPIAKAKNFKPEEIPFTIRNWDSRISDYFYLADRLGLRMIGVWGGWSDKPPYKPELPGLDICKKLDAKWVTGTKAAIVEREGFKNVTEESLQQGMTNFLMKYAGEGLAMICQGNEPHGTGQKVLDNVKAYKTIYEAVKAYDPKIEVVGTSVEPNEEYFKAGYQNYLDSYDFHIYEHYSHVRKTMHEYRELMQKYNAVKPIHSTELGLNSAGQARITVARELIKKCTVFFAEGGKTVSWFTIQYPDPKGQARGQFGDAHCVFDCKFNNYNPRLDAIAHYNMINSLLDKKFISEKQSPDGTQLFTFQNKDKETLHVIWNDQSETELELSIPANSHPEIIRIDGLRLKQLPEQGKLKLKISEDPILIVYSQR